MKSLIKSPITILLFLYLCMTSIKANAQIVNVQNYMLKSKTPGLDIGVSGSATLKTGNVDYFKVSSSGVVRFLRGNHTILGLSKYDYAEKSGASFFNKELEHLRYRYSINKRINLEAFIQHEMNKFKRLSLRGLMGLGPTFLIFDNKKVIFSGGTLYMFEYNKYSGNTDTTVYSDANEVNRYHRLDFYLTLKIVLSSGINFINTLYYQPSLTEFSDFRLLEDWGISFKVKSWLSFNITHSFSWASNPPQTVKEYDNAINLSITLALK